MLSSLIESSTCLLCLYMAKVSESILVVSGSSESSAVSGRSVSPPASVSAMVRTAVSLTAVESVLPPSLPLLWKKGMVGSAITNMKAVSSMNMTVLVLIANAGCKFTELKPNYVPSNIFFLLF